MNSHKLDPSKPIRTDNLEPISMQANEICNMIDAIYAGETRSMEVKGLGDISGGETVRFTADTHRFGIMSADLLTTCDIHDSRTAREIAAMLVAWADRQDGNDGVGAAKFLFEIARVRGSHPEV